MVTIIEGLDGVGKTTICKELCNQDPGLVYIKESYTSDNVEKEQRVRLMLERIMNPGMFLYDRTTLIDDFVYSFLNESESSLSKYLDIIIVLLSNCQIFHLRLDEQIRKQRFDERGDEYITNDVMEDVDKAYKKFYSKLRLYNGAPNIEIVDLSGVLSKDVKKLVRRMKNDRDITHSIK